VIIRPGDQLLIRDALDVWIPAVAASAIEGVWKDGKKIHGFPVVWVDLPSGRVPWPLAAVRVVSEETP
jgi:hypothetical protein